MPRTRWSEALGLAKGTSRARAWLLTTAILGVAACVSLSSSRGGGVGNVPVVRGTFKGGAAQQVRIALETGAKSGIVSATGTWEVIQGGDQILQMPSGTMSDFPLTFDSLRARQIPPGMRSEILARPVGGSFLIWNGKKYRGEIAVVSTDSGFLVVNRLQMDSYLRGVVPLEIGSRTAAEFAAVEAQAVAARTYAYKHLTTSRAFDMYATVQDQVYGGVDAEKPQSDSAIATTADVVVLYNGQPITTPYHSTCGGSTADLRPVSDRIPETNNFYCDPSPRFGWTQSYDAAGLRAVMEKYLASYTKAPKNGVGKITDIREQGRTPSGRVAALTVQTETGSYTLRGNDIRFVLRDPKGAILNSTFFSFTRETSGGEVSNFTVNGRGYGHGIGMCQWGAIGRARAGQNYRTILETYYPGTTIGRIAG